MPEPTVLEYQAKTQDLEIKLVQLEVLIKRLGEAVDIPHDLRINTEDAVNRISLLRNTIDKLIGDTERLGNVKLSGNLKAQFDEEIEQVRKAESAITNSVKKIAAAHVAANQTVVSSAANTGNVFAKFANGIINNLSNIGDSVTEIRRIITLVTLSRVYREIVELGKASVQTAVELQSMHNSFVALIGSGEKADETLTKLRETADTFGKPFLDIAENYLRFKVAGDAANLTGEQTDAIYNSIIVSSSALNQSQAQLNRTITAFEQILSKGILSAEEIRRQLGNALPGAFSLTARAIGVTNAELEKLLRSGTLLSTEVAPKIAEEMLRTFSKQAIANVSSARAEFGRFENDVLDVKKAIGDGLLPVILDVVRELTDLKDESNLDQLRKDVTLVATELKSVLDVLINIGQLDIGGVIGYGLEVGFRSVKGLERAFVELGAQITGIFSKDAANNLRAYWTEGQKGINENIEALKIWIGATKDGSNIAIEHNTRAAKSVEQIENALQGLRNKGSAHLEGFNANLEKTKGKIGSLAKELKEVEIGLESIDVSNGKAFRKNFNEMVAWAQRLEEIKIDAQKAGVFSGELATQIGALEARFDSGALAAGRFNAQLKELGIKSASDIRISINAFNEYVDAVEDSGDVTREQADTIVKAAKDILENIRKLPEGQIEASDQIEASLEKVIAKYDNFTTEAAKQAEKLKKETVKAFSGMADELENVFDKLRESVRIDEDKKGKDNLEDLREEFEKLQDKFNKEGLGIEELNRFNELMGEIEDKERDAGSALTEAFTNARREVIGSFEEIILSNDKLIEGVARLSPVSQQAFLSLISRFDELNKQSGLSEQDLTDFGNAIAEIFQSAGVNLDGFIAKLSNTATLSEKIKAQIADVNKQLEVQHEDKLGNKTSSEPVDTTESVSNIDNLSDSVKGLSDVWLVEGNHWKELSGIRDQQNQSIDELSVFYEKLRVALENGQVPIEKQEEAYRLLDEIYDQIISGQKEYNVGAEDVIKSNEEINESVQSASTSLGDLAESTREAVYAMEPITDQTRIMKNTTDDLNESIQVTNDVNEEMAAAFERNQGALQGLAERQADFNAQVVVGSENVEEGNVKLDKFGNVIEDTASKTEKAGIKIEESFRAVNTELETSNSKLSSILELIEKCAEATLRWKRIADGVDDSLETPT